MTRKPLGRRPKGLKSMAVNINTYLAPTIKGYYSWGYLR